MKRPKVTVKPPADMGPGPGEKIIEILFPSGNGCLVSLRTLPTGGDVIEVYRADRGIQVRS